MTAKINHISALEILDSRGTPTVECKVTLTDGTVGVASVPSGASVGLLEAVEKRDGDADRFFGRGVLSAVMTIEHEIAPVLKGCDPFDQALIDHKMLALDGSNQKRKLGANAILAVSAAVARAAAAACHLPFYRYLGGDGPIILPLPMMNIINGGAHANNLIDIQEFMVVPMKAASFADALQICAHVYQSLKTHLLKNGHVTAVGDEGGFAPNLKSSHDAFEALLSAIELAGFRPGEDVALALDVAASELYSDSQYHLRSEQKSFTTAAWVDEISHWVNRYPIVSIEDAMDQQDWQGWQQLTQKIGAQVQLVGDDVFVTQLALLQRAVQSSVGNAILIKTNQVGSITETFATIGFAKQSDYGLVISHRSGETADTLIADLAVATSAGQIKAGAPCRTDRVEKYNQLLRIELEAGDESLIMPATQLYR